MIFAGLRSLCFRHDHAHQVVGLRVFRCDADGVAGMDLGFGERAAAQQQQGEFVGGDEIVGIQRDDAADQRFGGRVLALGLADFVQHTERARPVGGEFQHVEAKAGGGFRGPLALRLDGAFDQGHEMADGVGGRQSGDVQPAAPDGAQAAATAAKQGDGGVHGNSAGWGWYSNGRGGLPGWCRPGGSHDAATVDRMTFGTGPDPGACGLRRDTEALRRSLHSAARGELRRLQLHARGAAMLRQDRPGYRPEYGVGADRRVLPQRAL